MEPDDLELLRAYVLGGDESAFAELVERHGGWIFAAARRRLGDDHLADDATQAVFVVLAKKAPQLIESKRASLSAWLFHVVHFTCARLRRTQSRLAALEGLAEPLPAPAGEGITTNGPLLLLMEESIAQLPAVEREIIVRRFYRRQRFAAIGEALGITAEAARKRLSRALLEIKHLMVRDDVDAIPDALLTSLEGPRRRRVTEKQPIDSLRIQSIVKEKVAMAEPQSPTPGGYQLISTEFLVKDVEENLAFFEKLGFPRRFIDKPGPDGRIPRASLTAGQFGKIWIRRAAPPEIHPSSSINVFFWVDGGPEELIAHRKKLADQGVRVTPIIDEQGLPNFNVITPDGYSIAFFTQYVAPS